MTLTIDATIGGENANSYTDVDFADDYFEGRFTNTVSPTVQTDWFAFTEEQKKLRLITATRVIDRMSFLYERATQTQALQFPRRDEVKGGGIYVFGKKFEITELPDILLFAVCELALKVIDNAGNVNPLPTVGPTGTKIKSETLGRWSAQYGEAAQLCSIEALNYLQPLLRLDNELKRE